jgi:Mycothiol maleylpyruvate isomerase N-terminal domain/MDMPI C-terminal domain
LGARGRGFKSRQPDRVSPTLKYSFGLVWALCQASAMDSSRYLESLAADFALLRAAVLAAGLDAPVPTCPGWTVAGLIRHVGEVYLHKTLAMRLGDFPGEQDWPTDLEALPPLDLLDRTYADLVTELTTRDPDSPAPSWYRPEPTVRFWLRRMAQETVIHRLDAELAAQAATGWAVSPVPDDIAADGVDEVLVRFLGYGSTTWPDEFAALQGPRLERADGDDTVVVQADEATTWTVRPQPDHVDVRAGTGGDVHAVVGGDPAPLLCWLWGRGGEEQVSVSGDPAWADYLRRLLVATTQ